MDVLTQFASSEPSAGGDVFSALGIDWQILIFQIVAFLILVWFLGKYVYPVLMRTVDARQNEIEAGIKAAAEAEKQAEKTKAEMTKLLQQARTEASTVVTTAKEEASALVEKADAKAKERAERTIADAQAEIEKNVIAAKKALHNETLELVALATEKVVGRTVSKEADEAIISAAIKEVK